MAVIIVRVYAILSVEHCFMLISNLADTHTNITTVSRLRTAVHMTHKKRQKKKKKKKCNVAYKLYSYNTGKIFSRRHIKICSKLSSDNRF